MIVRTYEPGEPKVIRGHVFRATAVLYHGPTVVASGEIPEKDWPFQTNNMSAWFAAAYGVIGAPMRKILTNQKNMEYSVNDGEGALKGRGSNNNKLSYLLRVNGLVEERVDVVIETKPAAAVHLQRIAKGHVPKPRKNWHGLTYLDPRERAVYQWQDATGEYLVFPMEEFYEEFPEWKGKLPSKGIDDPDLLRAGGSVNG